MTAAPATTIATFGRLDAAFNNTGVEQAKKATAEITEEEWDRIIGIDLRGTFLCMKAEIPLLLKQGGWPLEQGHPAAFTVFLRLAADLLQFGNTALTGPPYAREKEATGSHHTPPRGAHGLLP